MNKNLPSLKLPIHFLFFILLISIITSIFSGCNKNSPTIHKKSKILMDTIVTITVISDSKTKAEKAINSAFSELEVLESRLSHYSDDSEVSEINRAAGIKSVSITQSTFELIKRAVEISEVSSGAFEPTIGSIMSLWDFHKGKQPSDSAIKERISLVNYKKVIFNKTDSSIMLKDKGMLLDLGGIAKGYGADKAVDVLKKNGINAGVVAIAGDVKTFGLKSESRQWKVGIRNPRGDRDKLTGVLRLENLAVSTSGDYERFFISDGKRYHHLLNPRTGYPVSDFQSVSVVSPEGILADSLSTAVFILGNDQGMALINKLNLMAFIVDKDGKIFVTENLRDKIEF